PRLSLASGPAPSLGAWTRVARVCRVPWGQLRRLAQRQPRGRLPVRRSWRLSCLRLFARGSTLLRFLSGAAGGALLCATVRPHVASRAAVGACGGTTEGFTLVEAAALGGWYFRWSASAGSCVLRGGAG
ncbi:hypothetical protein T484DRAFT_1657616, partial [Baffinella frigidus]